MTSRVAVLVVVLLLAGTIPAGIAGANGSPAVTESETSSTEPVIAANGNTGSTTMTGADDILHRTTELRHLPDQPGEFEAEITFEIPEPMSRLEIEIDTEADVQSVDGFEATGQRTYQWTEETETPTIRFTMPANRRGSGDYQGDDHRSGDEQQESVAPAATAARAGSTGGYTFIDTGDWGVVRIPSVGVSYQKPESVSIGIQKTATVDGPGVAGSDIAFFGPVTEYERTVDGDTIRLAVSDDATLEEQPEDILNTLAAASDRLEVGSNSNEMLIVAVPTNVDWGPRGIQYGTSDAWVVADAELEDATNVWLHEYVHIRQGFANSEMATDARWLAEGQADYYAGLMAYEQGLASFSEFSRVLERGEQSPYADGVLADPTTWEDDRTDYTKGALVYGELDRQLRLATDGDRSLDDVFRQLNAQDERVSEQDVLAALEAAGGTTLRTTAEKYTRTPATPEMWSRFDHRDAFEQQRATIDYGLGSTPITVADRSWERWDRSELNGPSRAIGQGDILAVPAGERVTVPVAVTNVGDRAGTADPMVQANGKIVDYRHASLEAGEGTTETLSWTPTKPGIYVVRVGSDRLTVFVRSTPSLSVTDLQVDPERISSGESVTATATVTTNDDYPAAGRLEFRTAAETATGQPVALAPGQTGTVETTLTFDGEGSYEITAGGQSTTVSVGGLRSKVESMPGFGMAAGVVALGLVVTIAVFGRRQ